MSEQTIKPVGKIRRFAVVSSCPCAEVPNGKFVLFEEYARETARAEALQESIRQTCGHDGTCENCGAIPATQVPYQLCDDCSQFTKARVEQLEAALQLAWEAMTGNNRPFDPNEWAKAVDAVGAALNSPAVKP